VLRRLRVLRAAAGEPYPGTATGLLKQARWFLLRSLMSWSFSDLPIVLLRELSTSLQVSLFSLAMRSVGFVTQLFVVIGFVFYPALSNARSVSRPAFAKKIVDFVLLNTYVMPLAFGACLVGGAILIGVAGPAYRAAWLVLEVLAFAHVLSLGGFSGMPLVAAGAEKAVAKVMLASLLIFAGTAAWLMPILGALGGAVALLGCFFVAKLALLVLYRRGGIPLGGRAFALPFLSFGGLLIASLALPATLKIALLLALGLLSGVLTFRTLRRVAIF